MKGKLSIILGLALFLAVGLFAVSAQPAGAQTRQIDIGTHTTTGSWVGQQVVLFDTSSLFAVPSVTWNAGTQLNVTFAGSPVTVTNSGDDPVSLVTDGIGRIPNNTYFFRVPKGIRGANQLVFSGQAVQGGQTTSLSRALSFYIGAGIGVTNNALPDWSTSAQTVGRNVIIYGSHFGTSGTDSGIVVYWDGSVIASGIAADSDGRWETTVAVPESTGVSGAGTAHFIQATSIKLSTQGVRLAGLAGVYESPAWTPLTFLSTTKTVKPSFTLTPTTAKVGDTVNISGRGWAGTTGTTEITISVDISSGSTVRTGTTTPVSLKTSTNGTFNGAFRVPEFPIGIGGPVNVRVRDSAGTGDETIPMIVGRGIDVALYPNTGLGAISIEGSGFTAGSAITVMWGTTRLPTVPSTVSADANGNFTVIVSVPETKAGTYDIKVSDSSAEGRSQIAKFTVPSIAAAAGAGTAGPAGPAGKDGAAGAAGKDGAAGKAGAAGAAGAAGKAGADGKAGPAGPAGPAGAAGAAGKAGAAGAAGAAGKDAPTVIVIIALLVSIVAIILSIAAMAKKPAAPKA